jgi:hypothetical protein
MQGAGTAAVAAAAPVSNGGGDSPFASVAARAMGAARRGEPVQPGALDVYSLPREQQINIWNVRYERAEQVLAAYRDATRYPPESRPISDAPDQVRPFDAVSEEKSLRNERGEPVAGIKLRTTQDRVFMSGNDSVRLTVQAVNDKGQVLPLVVKRAAAQNIPEGRQLTQVHNTALDFSDAGVGADQTPGDGIHSAQLTPGAQGYASVRGTLRILAFISVEGKEGVAHFDVIYTPEVPAVWVQGSAGAREALENGSLNFYLKATVAVAGRYVVSGRVDDANGIPFAYVNFNDVRTTGLQEFKLPVFGALISDRRPTFPLRLRDVEGFLLIPDTSPDRAMLTRRIGLVHTSASYQPSQFSSSEWTSEERERYLAEYGRDVKQALEALQGLGAGPR